MGTNDEDDKSQKDDKSAEGRRYAGYGSTKAKEENVEDQRDPRQDAGHMPRHWQSPGTRGQAPEHPAPGPDQRETARGNQYGEAGDVASRQVKESLTEHGKQPPPQRRDNAQLEKRAGEKEEDIPTPPDRGGQQ